MQQPLQAGIGGFVVQRRGFFVVGGLSGALVFVLPKHKNKAIYHQLIYQQSVDNGTKPGKGYTPTRSSHDRE